MLKSATTYSQNNNEEDVSRSDDATVKVVNSHPVEDSDQHSDKATDVVVRTDTSKNKRIDPLNNKDNAVVDKHVEVTATVPVNLESVASTATSGEANTEIVLTFPQRVRKIPQRGNSSKIFSRCV